MRQFNNLERGTLIIALVLGLTGVIIGLVETSLHNLVIGLFFTVIASICLTERKEE